jgi:hypothetical protein
MRADKSTLYFANTKYKDRDWFGEREFRWLNLHAGVKPGKTVAEAQAELAQLQSRFRVGKDGQVPTNRIQSGMEIH